MSVNHLSHAEALAEYIAESGRITFGNMHSPPQVSRH